MDRIFEDEFIIFEIDFYKSIYKFIWKPQSENLTLEKLFEYAKRSLSTVQQYNIKNVIAVNTDFNFAVVPKVQEELNKSIFTALNNGSVCKFAHVISPDLIVQLSLEQMYDDNIKKTYEDKYFDNMNDAIKWCSL